MSQLGGPGPQVLTLDQSARLAVQDRPSSGILASGLVGIPSNAATVALPSIYRDLATPFDLRQQRDTIGANVVLRATEQITATFSVASYKRSGFMPWGASFAFNNGNEVPLALDNRTTDFSSGLEWANGRGMFRVGYDGSFFDNRIESLVWDNPLRATDFSSNATTVTGYDPNGYTNGNGPARGRQSLSPSNRMNSVNTLAMVKLPGRSSINGSLVIASMRQDAQLLPWTINPVINNPAVFAVFPGLTDLDRPTAEAHVLATNANVNFTTRPHRYVGITARYRYNNRDNRTPVFDSTEYVRFDAVPEDTGGETEAFSTLHHVFNVDASFTPIPRTAFRIGYGYDRADRTFRVWDQTAENTLRASVDFMGSAYLMVRGQYEKSKREGSGLDLHVLEAAGQQPAMRHFDVANRDRDRATLTLDVLPVPMVNLSASVAVGDDEYDEPDQLFGLLDNDHRVYTFGVNILPRDQVAFGASVGWEKYTSHQRSRNANPLPDPSWLDPDRDWTLDNDETIRTFNVFLDLLGVLPGTDVRLGYDYSDSDQGFTYGGPRIAALQAIGQFIPLPNVTNEWNRGTADIRYAVTERIGIGASYWYDQFSVSDFATVNLPNGEPRIDYLGGITTGYGNRAYKAHTAFVRMFYTF